MGAIGKMVAEYGKYNSRGDTLAFAYRLLGLDGGPGSGNFGHKGRPGKVGGSGKGGGKAFRATSKTSSSGFVGIQRAKTWKGIASAARASKNFDAFVDAMDKDQRDAIVAQHRQCGTNERFTQYAERVYNMLTASKPPKKPKNVIVHGKDISGEVSWDGKSYVDPKYGQVVDTEIEHIIVQQGFNGPPKVVTQEEFDRITKENPNMPILFRSYAAPNPDVLQDYDDMLEGGEWYVDCETGGAQYGQGMYCAGVYPQEALHQWDDPNYKPDDLTVFVDSKHNGYKTKLVRAEESGELIVGLTYLGVDKDGNKHLIQMDEDSLLWIDKKTGALVPESEVDEMCANQQIYECVPIDIGIYADAYDKERKKGIEMAKQEMEHYRSISIRRCWEDYVPELSPTEGYEDNSNEGMWIWDNAKMQNWSDIQPEDGQEIAVSFVDEFDNVYATRTGTWDAAKQKLVFPTGLADTKIDNEKRKHMWAPIDRKDHKESLNPQASTRMMTLDPSAKIISYDEALRLADKIKYGGFTCDVSEEEYTDKFAKSLANQTGLPEHFCKKIAESFYTNMESVAGNATEDEDDATAVAWSHTAAEFEVALGLEDFDRNTQIMGAFLIAAHASGSWKRRKPRSGLWDIGCAMAALGYDAINAEGHGNSGSYTVVLNRTKVILSEQRVDVE